MCIDLHPVTELWRSWAALHLSKVFAWLVPRVALWEDSQPLPSQDLPAVWGT